MAPRSAELDGGEGENSAATARREVVWKLPPAGVRGFRRGSGVSNWGARVGYQESVRREHSGSSNVGTVHVACMAMRLRATSFVGCEAVRSAGGGCGWLCPAWPLMRPLIVPSALHFCEGVRGLLGPGSLVRSALPLWALLILNLDEVCVQHGRQRQ